MQGATVRTVRHVHVILPYVDFIVWRK